MRGHQRGGLVDARRLERLDDRVVLGLRALRLAREVKFPYAANIEYEMDEKDPTAGVRRSFEYIKKALTAA